MKKLCAKIMFLGLTISFLCISNADAAIINASSCSRTNVQSAIDSASTGDAVVVPAGNCTWSSAINIPTGVTLKGAGIGQTVISGSGANLNDASRLTGFEFATDIDITVTRGADNWRIDNNKFQQSGAQNPFIRIWTNCNTEKKYMTGLIDSNTLINCRILTSGCGDDAFSDELWYTGWRDYDYDGEKIYIENNTIIQTAITGVVDGNYSGRFVLRFNEISEGYIEVHGARDSRGLQTYEIYRNNFNNSTLIPHAANIRGGTGVIFDNDCSGKSSRCEWGFSTERCSTIYTYSGDCDGNSAWDTTPHPATGSDYLCRDVFAGKDSQLGTGTQSSTPYEQESLPAYFWGNTQNGSIAWNAFLINSNCSGKLVEDRDFFMDDSSHSGYGNGGVSSGTWVNRPTCNASKKYHGYWATDMGGNWNVRGDDGALYVCDGVGTWELRYTPAPYPHPLTKPLPPQNLRISP